MLKLISERRFEKDLKLVKQRKYCLEKLFKIVDALQNEKPLSIKVLNHKLKGNFKDCWECHIESDWLLIYKKTATALILIRTGTHADLF